MLLYPYHIHCLVYSPPNISLYREQVRHDSTGSSFMRFTAVIEDTDVLLNILSRIIGGVKSWNLIVDEIVISGLSS